MSEFLFPYFNVRSKTRQVFYSNSFLFGACPDFATAAQLCAGDLEVSFAGRLALVKPVCFADHGVLMPRLAFPLAMHRFGLWTRRSAFQTGYRVVILLGLIWKKAFSRVFCTRDLQHATFLIQTLGTSIPFASEFGTAFALAFEQKGSSKNRRCYSKQPASGGLASLAWPGCFFPNTRP